MEIDRVIKCFMAVLRNMKFIYLWFYDSHYDWVWVQHINHNNKFCNAKHLLENCFLVVLAAYKTSEFESVCLSLWWAEHHKLRDFPNLTNIEVWKFGDIKHWLIISLPSLGSHKGCLSVCICIYVRQLKYFDEWH